MSKGRYSGASERVKALEEKYLPPDEVRKKYDGAVGL